MYKRKKSKCKGCKVTLEDGRFGYCDKCLQTKASRQLRSYHRHKEEINQRRKRNRELNKGRSTCANYNDNDINCVMCFENAECKFRNCFKEPK